MLVVLLLLYGLKGLLSVLSTLHFSPKLMVLDYNIHLLLLLLFEKILFFIKEKNITKQMILIE